MQTTSFEGLRDHSHKKQFLLGRFDWDGSHEISNGTVRTNLLGRFVQTLIYWDNSAFLIFKKKEKKMRLNLIEVNAILYDLRSQLHSLTKLLNIAKFLMIKLVSELGSWSFRQFIKCK